MVSIITSSHSFVDVPVPVGKAPEYIPAFAPEVTLTPEKEYVLGLVASFAALPVVLWLKVGQVNVPVLKSPDCGVPRIGVTSAGDVLRTKTPVPVPVYSAAVRCL